MRPLAFALALLAACGAPCPPTVPEPKPVCPTAAGPSLHCCEGEIASTQCVAGIIYVCEPSIAPCYEWESVDGVCPNQPDGGPLHPEFLEVRNVWQLTGYCP